MRRTSTRHQLQSTSTGNRVYAGGCWLFSVAFSLSRSRNEMIGTWLSTELDKGPLSGKLAALSLHIGISELRPTRSLSPG